MKPGVPKVPLFHAVRNRIGLEVDLQGRASNARRCPIRTETFALCRRGISTGTGSSSSQLRHTCSPPTQQNLTALKDHSRGTRVTPCRQFRGLRVRKADSTADQERPVPFIAAGVLTGVQLDRAEWLRTCASVIWTDRSARIAPTSHPASARTARGLHNVERVRVLLHLLRSSRCGCCPAAECLGFTHLNLQAVQKRP